MKFSAKIMAATAALGLCMAARAVTAQDTGGMNHAPASSGIGQVGMGMMHKMHPGWH